MYRIASIERIRELSQEIAAIAKLNALYKVESLRSEITLRASIFRASRKAGSRMPATDVLDCVA